MFSALFPDVAAPFVVSAQKSHKVKNAARLNLCPRRQSDNQKHENDHHSMPDAGWRNRDGTRADTESR